MLTIVPLFELWYTYEAPWILICVSKTLYKYYTPTHTHPQFTQT